MLNNTQITIVNGAVSHICTTGFGDPCIIVNIGSGILYLGDEATVSQLTGLPLASAGATIVGVNSRIDLETFEGEVWGYADGANCRVAVIQGRAG